MNYLLGPILLSLSAQTIYNAPLHTSSVDRQNTAAISGHPRHQRRVPDTSYALPENVVFKVDVSEPEEMYKLTDYNNFDGNFSYSFSSENGIDVEVKGSQKQIGNNTGQVMEGRYSYTAPDGTPVAVKWYADETGFHATILNP